MPNNEQTLTEDHPIIEITSSANAALFSVQIPLQSAPPRTSAGVR